MIKKILIICIYTWLMLGVFSGTVNATATNYTSYYSNNDDLINILTTWLPNTFPNGDVVILKNNNTFTINGWSDINIGWNVPNWCASLGSDSCYIIFYTTTTGVNTFYYWWKSSASTEYADWYNFTTMERIPWSWDSNETFFYDWWQFLKFWTYNRDLEAITGDWWTEWTIVLGGYVWNTELLIPDLITDTGVITYNGAWYDLTGFEVTQTGSLEIHIKNTSWDILYTYTTEVYDDSNILHNQIDTPINIWYTNYDLELNTLYAIDVNYITDITTDVLVDSIETGDYLYNVTTGDNTCGDWFIKTLNEIDGITYTECIYIPTPEDVTIDYETWNDSNINNSDISSLYGTGTLVYWIVVWSVAINTGATPEELDNNCKEMFDVNGHFRYIDGATPTEFTKSLNLDVMVLILGDRWELELFWINLIGWIYDSTAWLIDMISIVFTKIIEVLFSVFGDYIAVFQVPEREENYCYMGVNMYLNDNIKTYYSYAEQKQIITTWKYNTLEYILLLLLTGFMLSYIIKKV